MSSQSQIDRGSSVVPGDLTKERSHSDNGPDGLIGRNLYIPRMSIEGSAAFAAAYRSIGVNGQLTPESDTKSIELARQWTIGEECYPEIVTLGSLLMVMEEPGFDPAKTAFMMPTANGPCRFGQYQQLLMKVLREKGMEEVMLVSPTSEDGYEGIGKDADVLVRLVWRGLVSGDILRKLLLQTRPYETNKGETDEVHARCLDDLCKVLEKPGMTHKEKMSDLVAVMAKSHDAFAAIPADYTREKPFIGVVGEIYCRLDEYANANLIRRIENLGGEAWLAPISEWVWYTNFMEKVDLRVEGKRFSRQMLGSIIRNRIQQKDEHRLMEPLHDRFHGYEESEDIAGMLEQAVPYLPYWGALGEMVLNIGGSIYLHEKGVDGIIDISPFTCMNGIVCEAVYPKLSADHDNIPIRNFYFDGTESDYDRDVEIFLELANTYKSRKKKLRVFPAHFKADS